ncbi:MAG: hypothetical protein RIT27_1208 [Pseudomonadota bacterium]|jgi:hypothetical protein
MRIFFIMLSLVLSQQISQAADISTIIAVAATGNSQKSIITTATNAPFFLLFNNEGDFLKAIANQHKGEVGESAADLAKHGTTVLVASSFDRASLEAITAQDVIPVKKRGAVAKAIQSMTACEEPEKK